MQQHSRLLAVALACMVLNVCSSIEPAARRELGTTRSLSDPLELAARDSAEYAALIVSNPAPDPDKPAFRIDEDPLVRVGMRNDDKLDQELWSVTDALLDSRRNLIVILDYGSEIRVFDSLGVFVANIGRKGNGPGEFDRAGALILLKGDSVMVHDRRNQRFTVFTPTFEYARSFSAPAESFCCVAGHLLLAAEAQQAREMRLWPEARPLQRWRIVEPGKYTPLVIGEVEVEADDPMTYVIVERSFAGGTLEASLPSVPFARSAQVVPTVNGIIHATGDYYEYREYRPDGSLRRAVRAAAVPVPVSDADLLNARERFIAQRQFEPEARRYYERVWNRLQLPLTHPAFGTIRSDDVGNVLVRNFHVAGATPDSLNGRAGYAGQWWARFDSTGVLQGTVRVPDWHSVIRFKQNRVILRYIDPVDGFHWISVHSLLPTGNERNGQSSANSP